MGRRAPNRPHGAPANSADIPLSLPDLAPHHDAKAKIGTVEAAAVNQPTVRTPSPPSTEGAIAARARKQLGARAEDVVATYLAAQGMAILARNARAGRLEIDIIARDGPVIVVVEVRTRGAGSYVRALDSIDANKRARIRRAGEQLWRARFSTMRGVDRMRFDAASVTFSPDTEPLVEHVKAAF